MAPKKRKARAAKESDNASSPASASSSAAALPCMPDDIQDAIISFSEQDEWLSLRSVTKAMHGSYGTRLPSLTFRQEASTKALASLMEAQVCLKELVFPWSKELPSGVLSAPAAIIARGKCMTLKKISLEGNYTTGELMALAAVMELQHLPLVEALDLGGARNCPSFPTALGAYEEGHIDVLCGLKRFFEAALSLLLSKSSICHLG